MVDYKDFSGTPPTITELRADREQRAQTATPRDALISVLRDLDEGKINIRTIYICYYEDDLDENGNPLGNLVGYSAAGGESWMEYTALLQSSLFNIWDWVRRK